MVEYRFCSTFINSFQNKIYKDIYNIESNIDLFRYYIKKESNSVKITEKSKDIKIIDSINEMLSKSKITDEEAKIIVQLMKKKMD